MVYGHPALWGAVVVAVDPQYESGVREVRGEHRTYALIDHPLLAVQDHAALQIAILVGVGAGVDEEVYVDVLVGAVVPGPDDPGEYVVALGDAIRVLIDHIESPETHEEQVIVAVPVAVVRAVLGAD